MAIGDLLHRSPFFDRQDFTVTTLTSGLVASRGISFKGPDSLIWVSERGGQISRVDPVFSKRAVVGAIAVREW